MPADLPHHHSHADVAEQRVARQRQEARVEPLAPKLGRRHPEEPRRGIVGAPHNAVHVGDHIGLRRAIEEIGAIALVLLAAFVLARQRLRKRAQSLQTEGERARHGGIGACRAQRLLEQFANCRNGYREIRARGH